jgi:hypothetical protein
MRTVPHGNGTSTHFTAPVSTATADERVPASSAREDVVRSAAAPPRSPSNAVVVVRPATLVEDLDEVLVEDVRAGVTPAEMVEQKLRSLLRTRGISIELAGRARPLRGPGR